MLYITGDIHGSTERIRDIESFCVNSNTTTDDCLIMLGDVGINYFGDYRDGIRKEMMSKIPVTFVCIRGNHEARPEDIPTYLKKVMFGGIVFVEPDYPNIIFLQDGGEYEIQGKKILAIGGAYSVDKGYRLMRGYKWFQNEQLSDEEQKDIFEKIKGHHYDIVLTHTCPFEWQPTELFLPEVDQSKVDKTTEIWLGQVKNNISFNKWYFGHFHGDKNMGTYEMLYYKIKTID